MTEVEWVAYRQIAAVATAASKPVKAVASFTLPTVRSSSPEAKKSPANQPSAVPNKPARRKAAVAERIFEIPQRGGEARITRRSAFGP